jgi:peptidyl-prolyl cis-trans isomerase SurA
MSKILRLLEESLNRMKLSPYIIAFFLSVSVIQHPVFATTYLPIAVVNDVPITQYDINQRVNFLSALAGKSPDAKELPALKKNLISVLINERLQQQELARWGIEAKESDTAFYRESFLKQNNLNEEKFGKNAVKFGVSADTINSIFNTQSAWNRYILNQFSGRATITDDEVNRILQRTINGINTEINLKEILIAVDSPSQQQAQTKKAQKVVELLQSGTSFESLAATYSDAPSKSAQGNVGWVGLGEIDPMLARNLQGIAYDKVIGPIQTKRGYMFAMVTESRESKSIDSPQTVNLKVAQFNKSNSDLQNANAAQKAQEFSELSSTCDNFTDKAKDIADDVQSLNWKNSSSLEPKVASSVAILETNDKTPVIENEAAYNVYIVCGKKINDDLSQRYPELATRIKNQLFEQRIAQITRQQITDMRYKAVVKIYGEE